MMMIMVIIIIMTPMVIKTVAWTISRLTPMLLKGELINLDMRLQVCFKGIWPSKKLNIFLIIDVLAILVVYLMSNQMINAEEEFVTEILLWIWWPSWIFTVLTVFAMELFLIDLSEICYTPSKTLY